MIELTHLVSLAPNCIYAISNITIINNVIQQFLILDSLRVKAYNIKSDEYTMISAYV